MFDIGFSELMLISLVALIVIGPERLPRVARTVGHILGRVQRYVSDVKSDIRREIQLDELKKLKTEMQDSAREFETTLREEVSEVKSSLDRSTADARASIAELEAQLAEARAAADRAAPSSPSGVETASGPQLELGLDKDRGPGQST